MSYNRDRDCRIIFSRLQIAVMIYSIERGKSKGNCTEWKDLKGEYDNFEMDNFSEAARPINFGITQEHNFHQQYQGDGIWAQCDEDWVRFIAPCNINANIITSAISSRPNANTRLTLFNTAMTQLAQNDNISPTNLFSSINWTFVGGQEYFIRVENMNQVGTTYYTLQIGGNLTLLGDDNVCTTSNNYFMSNLPAGSGIVWTATPANIVTVNSPNSLQTTLTKITDGTITLTATVALCGAQQAIFRKSLAVGVSITPRTIYGIPDNYNNCQNSIFNVTSGGSGSFTWEVLGGQILSGQGGSEINIQLNNSPGNGFYIGLKENNVCGTSRVLGTKQGTIIYCDGGGGNTTTRISPNPTTGQTTISLVSDSKDLEIKEVRIKNKMGRIFVIQKFSNLKQKTIDLSTLPNDVYIVDVFDGKKWNSHKIIVQK